MRYSRKEVLIGKEVLLVTLVCCCLFLCGIVVMYEVLLSESEINLEYSTDRLARCEERLFPKTQGDCPLDGQRWDIGNTGNPVLPDIDWENGKTCCVQIDSEGYYFFSHCNWEEMTYAD